jgi:Ca2+:H+ antiporter
MGVDAVRRKAHRIASSNGDQGALNYNPFARTRSRDSPGDIENPVHRTRSTRSEANIAPTIEERRRLESREAEKDFGRPVHHDTDPSPTSPSPQNAVVNGNEPSSSRDVAHETNGEVKDEADSTVFGSSRHNSNNAVTKRAKFKGIFRKEHDKA